MSIYTIQSETLTDIADAIRSKTGSSALIPTENMASEITNIPSGGGNLHFIVTLTGPRAMQYDYVTSVYTFLSDTAGSLSISVTGLTDCGNNDAYISLEINGTEISRGTLVTDTSTTVSFPDTSIAVGDTVALNFGWVGNHGAEFNGSADITITCGGGGGITFPQFSETTIATGDSSGVTFTEDWHNYQFINIKSVNTSSNAVTYQLATPAAIDSIFAVNKYLVANEAGTNIYGSYANSSSTFWELKGSRSMRITEVTGLNCINGTVTETEIYNKGSYDTSQRALTGLTDLFSYDMFILCLSKDDIQPNCYCASKGLVFSDQTSFKTVVTPYDSRDTITITDTSMSSTYYHYVSGIKFT